MAARTKETTEIVVPEMRRETIEFCVLGRSPYIFNRMAMKAKQALLLPSGRKTQTERAATLKHNPPTEFVDSMNRYRVDTRPTRLWIRPEAFKGAVSTAALDTEGTKRTEVGRLCWVEGETIDIWGVPMIYLDVVRSADINRTPDIRTRARLEEWCARLRITYVLPKMNARTITALLNGSGLTCGVGDFRQEKGRGRYGQYEIVNEDHPDFRRLVETAGREAQDAAIAAMTPVNEDTEELLAWWWSEVDRRGSAEATAAKTTKTSAGKRGRRGEAQETDDEADEAGLRASLLNGSGRGEAHA